MRYRRVEIKIYIIKRKQNEQKWEKNKNKKDMREKMCIWRKYSHSKHYIKRKKAIFIFMLITNWGLFHKFSLLFSPKKKKLHTATTNKIIIDIFWNSVLPISLFFDYGKSFSMKRSDFESEKNPRENHPWAELSWDMIATHWCDVVIVSFFFKLLEMMLSVKWDEENIIRLCSLFVLRNLSK